MIKNKKQMFIVISVFALILFLGGTTYAWFNYRSETSEHELVAGEIYLHLNEGNNQITLTNVFPETPYSDSLYGAWIVDGFRRYMSDDDVYNNIYNGVRPVIEVLKSNISS